MTGTSRKRQDKKRSGEAAATEKRAGRSRKSPAAKRAEEALSEKKSRKKKTTQAAGDEIVVNKRSGKALSMAEDVGTGGFMGTEVAIVVTFAISLLLFLSNFGICGFVGSLFQSIVLGIFGLMGYLMPILLFMGTCFYLSNR